MASHDYDAACWLFEDEPVEVSVARQALVYPELADLGDLDNALVTIRFARRRLAVTHVSRTSPFGHDIRCEVVGTEGSVFVRGPGDGALRGHRPHGCDSLSRRLSRPLQRRVRRRAHRVRARACRGEGLAGPTLEDDRSAVAIGIAARASAVAAGRPLEVGTDWPWP